MKAQNIFGIVIRLFALALLLLGFWYFTYALAQLTGVPEETPGEMMGFFMSGGVCLVLGIALLRGARHIVRFSYPENRDDSDSTTA